MGYFWAFIFGAVLVFSNVIWFKSDNALKRFEENQIKAITKFVKENPTQNGNDAVQCVSVRLLKQDRNISVIVDHKWVNKCVGR